MAGQYAVVQMGARRDYAVPAILHKAGLLDRLFTDVCGDTGIGRCMSWGRGLPVIGNKLNRLANRRLPVGISEKTFTFPMPLVRHAWRARKSLTPANEYRTSVKWANEVGYSIARTGRCTHLYSMLVSVLPACPPHARGA